MSNCDEFTKELGIDFPLICGAMYPCSNPELVAAVSEAGGIGVIQPISLAYVHGNDLRSGIAKIKSLTNKPLGFNALIEKSSKIYEARMRKWVNIALDEGVRFFVTALGNPSWVVEEVHARGGIVYHDVTNRKWAERGLQGGVDGLICVNSRAGGHAGQKSPEDLMRELEDLKVPLVCAGGIGTEKDFIERLDMGYVAVQMGTRFIATEECNAHVDYKNAICKAMESDIVLTERISGIPVAVINTPYIESMGLNATWIEKKLLQNRRTKHYMRLAYQLKSIWQLKRASIRGSDYKDFFQAGKSVSGVVKVESASDVVNRFGQAYSAR
ncbi:MAG: nitronate monooxygenase [Kofleriaceae bacterium]|nr:nitronate monooxygenase [Kofleriaceae bacterium]